MRLLVKYILMKNMDSVYFTCNKTNLMQEPENSSKPKKSKMSSLFFKNNEYKKRIR